MKAKGAAVEVDLHTMTSSDLLNALKTVINNPSNCDTNKRKKQIFSLQELEEFVQSFGESGIVVFSLGSVIKNLTEKNMNMIAVSLAQIPQKVLVWPLQYSPWINIKMILDELAQRRHDCAVSSASILMDPNNQSALKFEVYPTPFTQNELDLLFMKWIKMWSYELLKSTLWAYDSKMQKINYEYSDSIQKLCEDAVLHKKLIKKPQESKFDVVLGDAFLLVTVNKKNRDKFYRKILGRLTTLCELMGKADTWLIRTYWDFEFPHPLLPNFEFVGGLRCKPAKPLP
ncbi:hypothetical protein HPG69_001437, partial [Diceros bicornis minor]